MTKDERFSFDKFIQESFSEGNMSRELRLSEKEVQYIHENYSRMRVEKMNMPLDQDGKQWYNVHLNHPIEKN